MTNNLSKIIILPILIFSLLIIESCCSIPSEEKYSKVKIYFQSKDEIKQLASAGLILDHTYYERDKNGFSLIVVLDSNELKILSTSELKYEILVDDLIDDYNQRLEKK